MSLDKIIKGLNEPIMKEEPTFDRDGIGESIHQLNRPSVMTYNNYFVRYGGKKEEEQPKEQVSQEQTNPAE